MLGLDDPWARWPPEVVVVGGGDPRGRPRTPGSAGLGRVRVRASAAEIGFI